MNNLKQIEIEEMIYVVRGRQVMLDSDLARLYQCKNGTKTINQAVKRHINRFPERFMFQLTDEELLCLRSQIGTANGKSRTLPYVFTEEGVAMLATVLRTEVAENVSIAIMDAFVMMRKFVASNNYDKRISNIETKIIDYDQKFDVIFDKLENTSNNYLFFQGQLYDAFSLMLDIFNISNESIIVVDNYIDKSLLDILSKINKKVLIITRKYNNEVYEKYKKQYSNISIKINDKFHDRFIIIDRKILYHCGASFKDLGKKCFGINKIEDKEWLEKLLSYI